MCQSFGATPDVAARLLEPDMRAATVAVLDVRRARQVLADFKGWHDLSDDDAESQAARWRDNGDGAFFRELMLAARSEEPLDG